MSDKNTRVYCTAVSSSQSVSVLIQYWYFGTKKSSFRVKILHRSATADHRTSCKCACVTHSHIRTDYTEERRSSPGSGHKSKRSGGKGTVRLQRVIKRSSQLQQQPQSANSPTFTRTSQIHKLIDYDNSTYFLWLQSYWLKWWEHKHCHSKVFSNK